jgi:hypothetical protein
MAKQTNEQTIQTDNLPALPVDEATAKELEDTEGVLELDDFTIKMDKDRKWGFKIIYADKWEEVDALPLFVLTSSEIYYAHFTGETYIRRDLNDPPPEEEADKWGKHGKLTIYHPKYGQGGFLLAPSGVIAFKSYVQKWKKQGVDVFGDTVKILSRTVKTKKGFTLNVPRFIPGQLKEMSQVTISYEPDSPTSEPDPSVVDAVDVDETEDDIPF